VRTRLPATCAAGAAPPAPAGTAGLLYNAEGSLFELGDGMAAITQRGINSREREFVATEWAVLSIFCIDLIVDFAQWPQI
jgi:hypothetical protein